MVAQSVNKASLRDRTRKFSSDHDKGLVDHMTMPPSQVLSYLLKLPIKAI